jgi:hypothetical protein
MLNEEGVRALFKGLLPRLLYVAPFGAVQVCGGGGEEGRRERRGRTKKGEEGEEEVLSAHAPRMRENLRFS